VKFSLVVINNFNVRDIAIQPAKTNAPLIVDANAVLTCSVTRQGFKPISGRTAQKRQCRRGM
jgi:hypothetical protein